MNAQIQNPPIPVGDTLFSKAEGVFFSYGPRVIDKSSAQDVAGATVEDVVPPAEGQEPEFFGVYLWDNEDQRWGWVADLPSLVAVQEYLKNV